LTLEPNPFRQSIAIALRGVRTQSENVDIIDVNGRLVQRLVLRRSASGIVAGAWDGADERGRKVAPGVYFCRPAFHGLVARILLVR
jgi:flagellar hook assembly protein FlgD